MHLPRYLAMLVDTERALADAYVAMSAGHRADADVTFTCASFARQATAHAAELAATVEDRYPSTGDGPDRLRPAPFTTTRTGAVGLLRDLAELHQLAVFAETTWELVEQAGYGLRDRELIAMASRRSTGLGVQVAWMRTRMKAEAAQALLVAT